MATETVPMDDKELFSAAMADDTTPPAESIPLQATELAPEPGEQPRDESGRFAPKTETAQADAAPIQQQPGAVTETKDDTGNVPSWRLRELREERDALRQRAEENDRQAQTWRQQHAEMERRLAEFQKPKAEPVDFFADPQAAFKQQLSPIEERFAQMEANVRMETSRAVAVARHGWEAVAEVEKAVADAMRANDPEMRVLGAQLANSRDPVGTAMQWYSNNRVMKETGGNLTAYRDKIIADAMKDPAHQAKWLESTRTSANGGVTGSGSRPDIRLPPSLNRTSGSGVTASELQSEDMSDRALFQQAVRR